jgi:Helix-turn-helix domain
MALQGVSMEELKLEVLLEPERTRETVAQACTRHGISRASYYRYRRRYLEEGSAGLTPRSRRRRSSPAQIEPSVLKAEGLRGGACGPIGEGVASVGPAAGRKGRLLARASVTTALIGLGAFVYTARFGDTLLGVAIAYVSGPLAIMLAVVAWWRSRSFGLRLLATLASLLAILLMVFIGWAVWFATTQSN